MMVWEWESLTERGVDVGPAEGTEEEQNESGEEGGGLVGEEDGKLVGTCSQQTLPLAQLASAI